MRLLGPAPHPQQRPRLGQGFDLLTSLNSVCTNADLTKTYHNLTEMGQEMSGRVFTAFELGTNNTVAIKQMTLKKKLESNAINEILASTITSSASWVALF